MYQKLEIGTDHPSFATTLDRIAQQYSSLGQYEKAHETYQVVLGKEINK
jgi:hypothetical protein